MILMSPERVLAIFSSFESYRSYPITYYVSGNRVLEVPSSNAVRVDAYVLFSPKTQVRGIIVHYIRGRGAVIEGFRCDAGKVQSTGLDTILEVIDEYVHCLMSGCKLTRTRHVIRGLSVLFGLDEKDVEAILHRASLVEKLEDRNVVIFDNTVFVLSRRNILVRYDGEDAVEVAREVAFICSAPIKTLREHIKKYVDTPCVVVMGSEAAAVCSRRGCHVIPLPMNIARLVFSKVRGTVIDGFRPVVGRRVVGEYPPGVDAIVVGYNYVALLRREGPHYTPVKVMYGRFHLPHPIFVSRSVYYAKPAGRGFIPDAERTELGADTDSGADIHKEETKDIEATLLGF